ncbi:MAG: flavodoxin family protein [Pygmaiobacter sp.]
MWTVQHSFVDAFVEFWIGKGHCDEDTSTFLEYFYNNPVFFFEIAGFYSSTAYFDQITDNVHQCFEKSNTAMGSFRCQDKMQIPIRERYKNTHDTDADKKSTRSFKTLMPREPSGAAGSREAAKGGNREVYSRL